MAILNLPNGIRIAGSDPIDYDRYYQATTSGRDSLVTSGRAGVGQQVYVDETETLYILKGITGGSGTWEVLSTSAAPSPPGFTGGFIRESINDISGATGNNGIIAFDTADWTGNAFRAFSISGYEITGTTDQYSLINALVGQTTYIVEDGNTSNYMEVTISGLTPTSPNTYFLSFSGTYFFTENSPANGANLIVGASLDTPIGPTGSTGASTGLEKITEGITSGWRLIGRDPTYYANIGLDAVDFSTSIATSNTLGAAGDYSFAEGYETYALGYSSHAEGEGSSASGYSAHAEGNYNDASGDYSHSEGEGNISSGVGSHSEGGYTVASSDYAHAEGESTTASGYSSHAEGGYGSATGDYSHSEGDSSSAGGYASHSEGANTIASGNYSHSEGTNSESRGNASHSEGWGTLASGESSHSEGDGTIASAAQSHAEGLGTIAKNIGSHAGGKYNIGTSNDTIREIGIGTGNGTRKNAFEIYTDGTLTAPESTVANIDSRGDTALITKKYFVDNLPIPPVLSKVSPAIGDTTTNDTFDLIGSGYTSGVPATLIINYGWANSEDSGTIYFKVEEPLSTPQGTIYHPLTIPGGPTGISGGIRWGTQITIFYPQPGTYTLTTVDSTGNTGGNGGWSAYQAEIYNG